MFAETLVQLFAAVLVVITLALIGFAPIYARRHSDIEGQLDIDADTQDAPAR